MIDIFSIRKGDLVEYGPYLCSESLKDNRSIGLYEDFMYWSPDERPVELWVNLIGVNAGEQPYQTGTKIFVRASQVTKVIPGQERKEN
jgi:hypothetical protein